MDVELKHHAPRRDHLFTICVSILVLMDVELKQIRIYNVEVRENLFQSLF